MFEPGPELTVTLRVSCVQFERLDPRPEDLPERPITTAVSKHKYLSKAFCEERVAHLNEYYNQLLKCWCPPTSAPDDSLPDLLSRGVLPPNSFRCYRPRNCFTPCLLSCFFPHTHVCVGILEIQGPAAE